MENIYLDNASTTKVDKEVVKAILPYFDKKYGNASSLHDLGQEAKKALEDSRKKLADFLKVNVSEIIFTSSGTESDNLAIKGVAFAKGKGHIITSKIEHPAVLETCTYLEKKGFKISYLDVDKEGIIKLDQLNKLINKDTILVSIMHANNEIGTIQPIKKISEICKQNNVLFHSDMVQSFGKIPIDFNLVDLASISAHKIYGPKGIGALYVRKGTKLEPIIHGGGHEFGLRSSTENIALIVGFVKAAELVLKDKKENKRQEKLRDYLIKELLKIKGTRLNGSKKNRLPNNVNVSFDFVEGESLVFKLNFKGISVSTGSACSSKKLEASHVLLATGLKPEQAHGSLRITLGKFNKEKDIKYLLKVLPDIVKDLRKISPLR